MKRQRSRNWRKHLASLPADQREAARSEHAAGVFRLAAALGDLQLGRRAMLLVC